MTMLKYMKEGKQKYKWKANITQIKFRIRQR